MRFATKLHRKSITRTWLLGSYVAWAAMNGFVAAAHAQQEFAVVPKPGTDHTAHRLDTEVLGWNQDYTELAAVGIEINRNAQAKQRGEIFLLVFDVGSIAPKHNVFLLNHTQAPMPHDPLPLLSAKDRVWAAGHDMKQTWYRKPKTQRFAGAMFIDAVWDLHEVSPGLCQPWVGHMLTYKGALRYQPHQPMRLKQSCELLRMTDVRYYWAKRDLGASLVRFDYARNEYNEASTRFVLSAAWSLAAPIRILLRVPWPKNHKNTLRLVRTLRGYGEVRIERGGEKTNDSTRVVFTDGMSFMVRRITKDVNATTTEVGAVPGGSDILVDVADKVESRRASRAPGRASDASGTQGTSAQRSADRSAGKVCDDEASGAYLRDWSLSP